MVQRSRTTQNFLTLNIPHALEMPSNDVVIRRDGERLIIEPFKKRSLLELLATLEDIDEDFPNVISQFANPYQEFAQEDRELAEVGISEYAEILEQ